MLLLKRKKKTLLILFSLILAYSAFSQEAVVLFQPKVDTVSIDSVHVTNLTRGQSVKLASGEAVVFNLATSVDYNALNGTDNGYLYPNPFNESTILNFNTSKKQEVIIAVYSLSGKLLSNNTHSLPPGNHRFQLRFPTSGLFNILVLGNREPLNFKAVSTGKSQQDFKISYVGSEHLASDYGLSGRLKSAQNVKSLDYSEGDVVHYTVFSGDHITVISDKPVTSKTIEVDFYECRDPDNRNYKIVQIGDQWWMAENLAYLPKLESPVSDFEPYHYVYGYTGNSISEAKATNNFKTYGVWYNWHAALEACPVGWHLPGDAEWAQLENYLADNGYNYDGTIGGGRDKIAKSLAASIYWESSAIIGATGNNLSVNDKSGFSGLPGGYCGPSFYVFQGQHGHWWSSTERDQFTAWARSLSNYSSNVFKFGPNFFKGIGTNVRCVKDENTPYTDTGHILFHTNAQNLLDGREFNVNVYINDALAGELPGAFLPQQSVPSCDMTDTLSVLKLQKPVGAYSYTADFYYTADLHYKPLGWSGNFEIKKDSCTVIYLSLIPTGSNLPGSRLTGTWAEKYPELWDGISDTIVFTNDFKVEKHFAFNGWNYNIMSDSTIIFQNENSLKVSGHELKFIDDEEIIIGNFFQRSITQVSKNTHFIKIE